MADFYQRFIEGFSKIARPMTALLAKKVEFKWTPACQESFEMLKQKLTTTVVAYSSRQLKVHEKNYPTNDRRSGS
jgi:hypothetical protein